MSTIRITLDIFNPFICEFRSLAANSILLEEFSADQDKPYHGEQEEYGKEWGPGHRWSQAALKYITNPIPFARSPK